LGEGASGARVFRLREKRGGEGSAGHWCAEKDRNGKTTSEGALLLQKVVSLSGAKHGSGKGEERWGKKPNKGGRLNVLGTRERVKVKNKKTGRKKTQVAKETLVLGGGSVPFSF